MINGVLKIHDGDPLIKLKTLTMKKIILTMIVSIVITLTVFTQSAGDYRSIANGNWNNAAKWETL